MNKVMLIGNAVRDVELRETKSGVAVSNFTLAVNRNYLNADGEKETDFFGCIAWRALAESVGKYVHKGDKICVVGQLQNRQYEDKEGNKRTITEILAESVEFLVMHKAEETPRNVDDTPNKKLVELEAVKDDDLPF